MQSCTSLHSHMFMYLLSHNCTGKEWHRLHREDREKVCKCISWVFRFSLAIVSKHAHLHMCSQQIMAAKYVSMGSILLWIHASFWTMCYTFNLHLQVFTGLHMVYLHCLHNNFAILFAFFTEL